LVLRFQKKKIIVPIKFTSNGMFGTWDDVVLSKNKEFIEGGNASINSQVGGKEAMFKGANATNFMDGQGYEFRDKTSFSNVRTFYAANQILPTGGSVTVVNKSGLEVVTARTYVEKGMDQNSTIKLFESTDRMGGYSSIFKRNYTYEKSSSFETVLKFLFGAIDAKNGDYSQENNGVDKVYGWKNVTDKSLLKYKNK
jgi:hypothetical protein